MTKTVNPDRRYRCTRATLEALGVPGCTPKDGNGILDALFQAGYRFRTVPSSQGQTIKEFAEQHPSGSFYLVTENHAMALINNTLTDTTEHGPDARRLVGVLEILGSSRANRE